MQGFVLMKKKKNENHFNNIHIVFIVIGLRQILQKVIIHDFCILLFIYILGILINFTKSDLGKFYNNEHNIIFS